MVSNLSEMNRVQCMKGLYTVHDPLADFLMHQCLLLCKQTFDLINYIIITKGGLQQIGYDYCIYFCISFHKGAIPLCTQMSNNVSLLCPFVPSCPYSPVSFLII